VTWTPSMPGLPLTELGDVFGKGRLGLTSRSATCATDLDRSTANVAADEGPEVPDPRLALVHGSPHGRIAVRE
jgi:hypothetical protein